jgi:hypothetical protein
MLTIGLEQQAPPTIDIRQSPLATADLKDGKYPRFF